METDSEEVSNEVIHLRRFLPKTVKLVPRPVLTDREDLALVSSKKPREFGF